MGSIVYPRVGWSCVPLGMVDLTNFPVDMSVPLDLELPGVYNDYDAASVDVRVVMQVDGAVVPLWDYSRDYGSAEGNERFYMVAIKNVDRAVSPEAAVRLHCGCTRCE